MNLLWFHFSSLTIGVSVARFVWLGTHLSWAVCISERVFLTATRVSYFREWARGLEPTLVQIALTLAATAVVASESFSMCLF